jgi:hypothetical protein
MRFRVKQISVAAVALLAAVYAYDYVSVHHRMGSPTPSDPFDVVTYPNVLAIPQKGNRVEYALDARAPMESDPCVHSMFPHFGYTPCWYVRRRSRNPTPMVILIRTQISAQFPARRKR